MTTEQLRAVRHALPFRPFRMRLADGRHLDVLHGDFLSQSPTGRTVIVYNPDDTFEIIDLLLVTSLEILDGKERQQQKQC